MGMTEQDGENGFFDGIFPQEQPVKRAVQHKHTEYTLPDGEKLSVQLVDQHCLWVFYGHVDSPSF